MRTTTHIRIGKETLLKLRALTSITGQTYDEVIRNAVDCGLVECAIDMGYAPRFR